MFPKLYLPLSQGLQTVLPLPMALGEHYHHRIRRPRCSFSLTKFKLIFFSVLLLLILSAQSPDQDPLSRPQP